MEVSREEFNGLGKRVSSVEIANGKLETRVDGVEKDMSENGKILQALFHKIDSVKESIHDLQVSTAVSQAKLIFIAGGVTAIVTFLINKFTG